MRVVILGSGYSAIWCYRALRRRLGRRADITVVAPFGEQVFHGFTGEVLDGGLDPALQTSPLTECLPHARRIRGWARAVDPRRRTVTVEWQGARWQVEYDELVVATGARERTAGVPGLAEHGWPLRFPGMVPELIDHLARLQGPVADPLEAQRRSTVVVVGAGLAGTEVAAALGRRYGTTHRVVLVSATAQVAPAWQEEAWLHTRLARNLAASGVEVLTGSRVARVDEEGVRLANGLRIPAATVVSTLGNVAPALPGLERFQGPDGLLQVDATLRVTAGVWSAGDAAAVRTRAAAVAPKDAIWAIRAGTRVGRNIARAARGAAARPLGFRGIGTVAAFAPGRAVAKVYGIRMSGPTAWLVRAAFFLWYVPSRRTALKILRASAAAAVATPLAALVPARRPATRPALVPIEGGRRPVPVLAERPQRRGA